MLNLWNPDKHLRIHNPRLRLALRMAWYSMVGSSIGGVLFSLTFLLDFSNAPAEDITQALILALFFGGGTALQQRLLASILMGVALASVSGAFSKPIAYPWLYRFAMGLTAATVVHLFAPVQLVRFYLTELTGGEYDARLEIAAVAVVYSGAIYLSQFVAGKYIRETATGE